MALAPLSPLVGALVALGLAALLTLLTLALVKFLSAAPVIGGWIADKAQAAENAISNALGRAFQGIDSFIGGCIHHLARFMDRVWHTIAATPHLLLQLAETIARISGVAAAARSLAHTLEREFHGIEHGVRDLRKTFHGIDRLVKRLERDLTKGIGHDLRLELRSTEKSLARVETQVIPEIRSIANTAENDVTALRKWIADHALIAGTTALVGAVAWALSQLGLGGLRCPSFTRLLGKYGCGLGSLLDGLLGLVISALALENVCSLLPVLETAFGDVVGPIIHLLTEVPLGSCEQPPSGWARLNVAAGPLPPAQTLGTLPA